MTGNRYCLNCKADISSTHHNRKYCSDECYNKARYKREGQRSSYEQRSNWYKQRKTKTGYIDKIKKQGRERRGKVQRFIRKYKMLLGCADCGYKKHHVALDFDHVKGEKLINVCNAKSISQAREEIRKCEVVCSNCHRIRTYERMSNND